MFQSLDGCSESSRSDEEDSAGRTSTERIEDSGVGSASERATHSEEKEEEPRLSVRERAHRLQGQINAREEEAQRKAALRFRGSSVDSLLDWESDSTRPPSLPPRGLPPPAADEPPPPPLPPKQKRVSISEVHGGGGGGPDSLESMYSTESKFCFTPEDGYMEDGYIIDHKTMYSTDYVKRYAVPEFVEYREGLSDNSSQETASSDELRQVTSYQQL